MVWGPVPVPKKTGPGPGPNKKRDRDRDQTSGPKIIGTGTGTNHWDQKWPGPRPGLIPVPEPAPVPVPRRSLLLALIFEEKKEIHVKSKFWSFLGNGEIWSKNISVWFNNKGGILISFVISYQNLFKNYIWACTMDTDDTRPSWMKPRNREGNNFLKIKISYASLLISSWAYKQYKYIWQIPVTLCFTHEWYYLREIHRIVNCVARTVVAVGHE